MTHQCYSPTDLHKAIVLILKNKSMNVTEVKIQRFKVSYFF